MRNDALALLARVQAKWVLLVLVILAAGLRLWHLDVLPPGLFVDEAYNGLDASRIVAGVSRPIFFAGNNGREPLYIYLQALSVTLLGPTPLALRMTSAAIGIATIPVIYFAARVILLTGSDQYNSKLAPWLALIAAAGVAVSYWHLSLSRLGFRAVLLVPVAALAIAFFWRAWTGLRWRDYIWSGVWFGVAFYTYTAARALPAVILAFVMIELLVGLIHYRSIRSQPSRLWQLHLKGLLLMAFVAGVIALPLLTTLAKNPLLLSARTEDVSIFVVPQQDMPGTPIERLWHNAIAVANNFYSQGDQNLRHNLPGRPVNDPLLAVLFTLGWLRALWCLRRPRNRLLLIWLTVMLTPTVLSTDAPHSLRSTGALPVVAMFYAVGGEAIYAGWKAFRNRIEPKPGTVSHAGSMQAPSPASGFSLLIPLFIVLLILGISGSLTTRDYFRRWAGSPKLGEAFEVDLQLAAAETATVLNAPGANKAILLSGDLFSQPQLRFAVGEPIAQQSSPPQGLLDPSARQRNTQFIFDRSFDPHRAVVL
ncbi:MAG: glycosyltransferase family 39 protein, partial [Anaerolineae bacterium]|nr:glycosyltransferase family 39 protein [Anaerolineae bacterium]